MFWSFVIFVSFCCVSNINGANICNYCNCVDVSDGVEVKCKTSYSFKKPKDIDFDYVNWPVTNGSIKAFFQDIEMTLLPK